MFEVGETLSISIAHKEVLPNKQLCASAYIEYMQLCASAYIGEMQPSNYAYNTN